MKINLSQKHLGVGNYQSICVKNNKVYINGKLVENLQDYEDKEITLIVDGDVKNIDCSGNVQCGNVSGDIDCSGSIHCGDVQGDIDCSGSCTCGSVGGDIDCSGSVKIIKG